MAWMTTRGNKIVVMSKKKKDKKVKPLPAPKKKKQKVSMRPEERARHWEEIKDILLNAKREAESLIKKKLTKERSFTTEDINSFICDLKFKSPEENKKPGPLHNAVNVSINKTGQSNVASSEMVTNTYYERWFRLVSQKPTTFEESQPEEVIKVEHKKLPRGVSSTVRATYDLYKEDLTVDEIAEKRKMTVGTIYGHLSQLIGIGVISIYELLSNSKIKDIALAIKKVGGDRLSDIKSHCTSSITYEDIKLMLSHLKRESNKDKKTNHESQ